MLGISQLTLIQFRNYIQKQLTFSHRIVGIIGPNGTGKTNILDALYYLSFTKSYFNRPDAQNVHHDCQGMRVEGHYDLHGDRFPITCIVRENLKKELYYDGALYSKLSQHIGRIPCVMIAPDDVQIITGSSEERRRLMDSLLSQLDPLYLKQLIQYNKVLLQRNSLLKQAAEQGHLDVLVLEVLDEQLAHIGTEIYKYRKDLLIALLPEILNLYEYLAGQKDAIDIVYQSALDQQSFTEILHQNLQKDKVLQRTSSGIHKDDLIITIQGQSFKQEASQGQRKSLLFAIRLAEWIFIRKNKGIPPILLMDDIFEKLDATRMSQLLQWVSKHTDGQVFITDTHQERVTTLLTEHLKEFQIIAL